MCRWFYRGGWRSGTRMRRCVDPAWKVSDRLLFPSTAVRARAKTGLARPPPAICGGCQRKTCVQQDRRACDASPNGQLFRPKRNPTLTPAARPSTCRCTCKTPSNRSVKQNIPWRMLRPDHKTSTSRRPAAVAAATRLRNLTHHSPSSYRKVVSVVAKR
ncbi:hypothetical protein L1887_43637 [Cichorium endivia]|nr:hypothetical protein L1887_43637 [Cichorium endivia]